MQTKGARFKNYMDIGNRLKNYDQIYQVASEIDPQYIYGISDGKMAVFTYVGMVMWDFFDTEEVAEEVKKRNEKIGAEILEIYEDVKNDSDIIYSRRTYQ